MDAVFGHGERRTAHEMVRETLRRVILEGTLPAGTHLVQAEIAEQLRVSTTPVREALRDLVTEGLVELDPHRGAVVHSTSLDEVVEIYDLRGLLEPEAVRRAAANLTEEELGELEALHKAMDAEQDPVQWTELNRTFHRQVVAAAGSARLAETLHRLEDVAALYVGVALRSGQVQLDAGNAQHHELVQALRARDHDRAASVIAQHLQHTLEVVREAASTEEGVGFHATA